MQEPGVKLKGEQRDDASQINWGQRETRNEQMLPLLPIFLV